MRLVADRDPAPLGEPVQLHARVSFASAADCGHSITLDRPAGLLEAVSPWLAATAAGHPS